jgi:carbon monoxide dehydrogenase subunit G
MSWEMDHFFTVPVSADRTWDVLLNVERIWPCVPGATLDEVNGDLLAGRIKVKVGPVSLTYRGTARFTTRDADAKVIVVEASGQETRGAGTASATIRALLEPQPGGQATKVSLHTTMNVTGRPAQFGRGVMIEVGGKLVEQFARNLAQELAAPGTGADTSSPATARPAPEVPVRPPAAPPAAETPARPAASVESGRQPPASAANTAGAATAPPAAETPDHPPRYAGIFISYRREDAAYAAGWLYDRLASHFGHGSVFKDVDTIQLGDDFVEMITEAVGACQVLLAVIGSRWLTVTDKKGRRRLDDPADFVRLEIEAALERGVRVIPVLVEGASMPSPTELPTSLEKLARRQALVLSPDRFDTSSLLRVLNATLISRRS